MTVTDEPEVLVSVEGGIGRLVLNRPRAINALTLGMVHLMDAALDEWEHREDVHAVLLTGAGERGLCAGGDIRAIYADARNGTDGALDFWREEYRLNVRIAEYPKPYVAVMSGLVLGGGVGIAAHGSHRIVTDSTRVGMPEVTIGFVPDVGGTRLLTRSRPALGAHIALTSADLGPGDAIAAGLADHYVPESDLPAFTASLAIDGIDAAVSRHTRTPPAGPLAVADWIEKCYLASTVPDILALLDSREEEAAGEAAAAIRAGSPIGAAVTLRALQIARTEGSLRAALNREFVTGAVALRSADFREGVRARIIDKDRRPRWDPADLDHVTTDMVQQYFTTVPDLELPFAGRSAQSGEA